MNRQLQKFLESTDFIRAVKVAIAAATPVILFSYLDLFSIGFTIALGALFTFISDIPGNLRHRINGMLASNLIATGSTVIVSLATVNHWIFYPVLILLVFFLSMIAVYGHRATLVSFSGLLAMSLSFAHSYTGWDLLEHAGLMIAGGLFYLCISMTFHYIRPYRYAELQMAECILLTARYLKLRGKLWDAHANRDKITEKLLTLQIELNDIHEKLRETLIRNRTKSGSSNQNRRLLIAHIELEEILELAMATSFDYEKLHQAFGKYSYVLNAYQHLAYNLAALLNQLGQSVEKGKKYTSEHRPYKELESFKKAIDRYEAEAGLSSSGTSEEVLMLINMFNYVEKQVEKIKVVEYTFTPAVKPKELKRGDRELEKLLTLHHYSPITLTQNLSFSSTIFRHSLRLTLTVLAGFLIGNILTIQNTYWILLTIVVIMRPGYGLTKQRSYHRTIGTLAGGAIAFGIISIVHNTTILGILAMTCMVLGFSFTQRNYPIAATFITLYVIFVYGMLSPDIQDVILFRITDTLIGTVLAFSANHFLWPSWEFLSLPTFLEDSIKATRDYIREISVFYNKKGEVPLSYPLARKHAFIETGNLMASFQRMTQEPKSRQKQLRQFYTLVVLNHALLSSAASLGAFIQSRKTTKASEAFNAITNAIIKNLDNAAALLTEGQKIPVDTETRKMLNLRFTELKAIREKEIRASNGVHDDTFKLKMEESQLVIQHLIGLTNLSENIEKAVREIQKNR
ncbi:FUSC family protein [Sinomicrobium weinanense]|uniref:FUSC family protein n=1 Tax=Sinomicrobium weinanense TaxID=2842200 RepID=A0A926JV44_9FLAO|nr:FUSC family membrane protein [Sinomicrobium weinanense]MBC9797879.1 FUSC family protein [Sinomicrobium weinanense]MBU3122753.1 FUSC family protein [Sinomicrobium weinanense]